MEPRYLLSNQGFLHGIAFYDNNNDNKFGPGDAPKVGATIELHNSLGAYITNTTTDPHGYYKFDNLSPGTYQIVEPSAPLYSSHGTQILSQLNPALPLSPNTIQVTLLDPTTLYTHLDTYGLGGNRTMTLNGSSETFFAGQLLIHVDSIPTTSSPTPLNPQFVSFCVDLVNSIGRGDIYQAFPRSTEDLPRHQGEIAYLYNHYYNAVGLTPEQESGLQIAIWELLTDNVTNLSAGNFQFSTPGTVLSSANSYLAEAASSNYEVAMFLDAEHFYASHLPNEHGQGLLATESYNFANTQQAQLSGTKWEDHNGNGVRDGGDQGLPGWHILINGVDSATTDANGNWSVSNLAPGTYTVQEVLQTGWTETFGTAGYSVIAASGVNNGNLDFGNFKNGSITGTKYKDLTSNSFSADDTPLGGVTINLYQGSSTSGGVFASTTTAANGTYTFGNLMPGTYFVQEAVPNGYIQTGGNAGYVVMIGGSGGVVSGGTAPLKDFDNALKQPGIDIEKTTNGPSNSNPTAPDYNNEDAVNGPGVPILTPGSAVTWTYKVTNTGNIAFALSDVVVVDDSGTPGNTSDDLSTTATGSKKISPTLGNGSTTADSTHNIGDLNNNNFLDPNEVWYYTASGTVLNLAAPSTTTTFNFSGSTALNGAAGNIRSFNSGTVFVNASAFSRDKSNGTWATSYLGSYSGGLGVTDTSEDGNNNTHTVDNGGRDNYVLLEFSDNVVVDAAFLGYVVGDSDLTVWIGTKTDPFNNHQTLSDSFLTGLGYTEVNLGSSSTRTADLNAGARVGNVLVIAAKTGDADDMFKVQTLTVAQTTAGSYENKGTVTVPGATDSDLSHYRNPPGAPGIDIEKLVNGQDADTEATAVQIAAGSPVTWTYNVKNTGAVPFTKTQVVVKDDNGTPTNTADDFAPTFVSTSDAGGDNILSPGETWTYTYTKTAQDLTQLGSANTFTFSGNTATSGTAGNTMTVTAGGISVKASGFSRDKSTGAWSSAYLGAYSGGLGVTDSSEGTGGNNQHTVDNGGRDNYVLFEFSDQVIVDSAFLGYVVGDSDLTLWIGTKTDPFNNHLTLSDSLLTSLGFTEVNDTTLTTTRTADFNAGNVSGNVLVIAARTGGQSDDYFKINNLVTRQMEPGVYVNIAKVTAGSVSDQDAGYYRNPDCVDITYSFAGSTATTGTKGNIRTYTVNNVSVNVSGFSRTNDSAGTWDTAYLGAYADGLGVTDTSEDGNNGTHRVDNIGRWNFVLFEFSTIVEVDRAFLDSVVGDSDVSIWVGTANNPFHNHLTLSDSLAGMMTYSESNDTTSTAARWADFNPNGVKGNVLVIAASVSDTTPNDQFKISKLEVCAEATKFFVVDPTNDNTYEYGPTGQALANYKVNLANTNSRGVATTAAGNKVWVIDSNKNVYVYDMDGKLLGSWAASGLTAPEDITTNGTDIWIVDGGTAKKVFKFSGAASRLSGSQAAASSFALNSANAYPTGIVTDGTNLWVVDNSTTDKVFKYSLSGTLSGSWTIDAANSNPSGITIDPTNVSNIWIVDSGTDYVYRYNAAASRISGSQTAAAKFQLASGNINPQGIADPPPDMFSSMLVGTDTTPAVSTRVAPQVTDQALAAWADSPLAGVLRNRERRYNLGTGARLVTEGIRSAPNPLAVVADFDDRQISRRSETFDMHCLNSTDATFDEFDTQTLEDDILDSVAEDRAFQVAL